MSDRSHKLKEGDRVRVTRCIWCPEIVGEVGTVQGPPDFLVRLDNPKKETPEKLIQGRSDGWYLMSQDLENLSSKSKKKKVESEYRRTSDGFLTCDDNWKPKNWLV